MNQPAPPAYPLSRRDDIVEVHFGEAVADPWRWLENDVRVDPEVAGWVAAQNRVTQGWLATLPGRASIAARLGQLWDQERYGLPVKRGGCYFYRRNAGLQNQSTLLVEDATGGEARLLIDPNGWSDDGATALAEWRPSLDGARLAYAVQDGGTDWRTLRILDVATGEPLADEVRWAKFSGIAWSRNGAGFFYSRFPEPAADAAHQSLNLNHAVWFHVVGTPQSADRLIHATPDRPQLNHVASVTSDGRWLLIHSSEGTDERFEVTLIDLTAPRIDKKILVRGLDNNWALAGSVGSDLYFITNLDAPRQRLVRIDVSLPSRPIAGVVDECADTLESAMIVGDRLVLAYMVDAHSELRLFALDGTPAGAIALPGIGSVAFGDPEPGDPELSFGFESFTTPLAILRVDPAIGTVAVFKQPAAPFDPAGYQVEQRFFDGRDGARVPMFVAHRRGLDLAGGRPTILYGYGGFNVPLLPAFSPAILQWMEMGGVYVVANLRGGGEYGRAWHDAGRRANKQTVFDDCIAAAEHLIAAGITTSAQLGVEGRSNGGLLVGAVINQRPDLFAVGLPGVGVMDMLRFNRFTAGRYWVDDYGDPGVEADFRVLRAYSPCHNIPASGDYPAILITTADTDDRVVPGHSFKYAAALQAADLGRKPRLIRIETRAGHGMGKPTDKLIAEYADLWAFAAHWTGLE